MSNMDAMNRMKQRRARLYAKTQRTGAGDTRIRGIDFSDIEAGVTERVADPEGDVKRSTRRGLGWRDYAFPGFSSVSICQTT